MREIVFYRTESGKCPVEEFLESLSDKQVGKILWVLSIVKSFNTVPKQYFKKLTGTRDIWEVRVQLGNNNYRILGFFDKMNFVILTNAFAKKTSKVPREEIKLAHSKTKKRIFRKEKEWMI